MKRSIIILIFATFLFSKGIAQQIANREPALSYYGQYVQVFFENYHKIHYNNQFSKFKNDIEIIVRLILTREEMLLTE